ncbi:unnamed protein product [Arabidopsis thaliana]|uniref:Uncharacterized protein n=1 Tax=Arabidopsis thaliana TaxID=3702 RepID=A0A654G629_ARATH|nr:unnamed protein product [Arabidopsis thaliana]
MSRNADMKKILRLFQRRGKWRLHPKESISREYRAQDGEAATKIVLSFRGSQLVHDVDEHTSTIVNNNREFHSDYPNNQPRMNGGQKPP